ISSSVAATVPPATGVSAGVGVVGGVVSSPGPVDETLPASHRPLSQLPSALSVRHPLTVARRRPSASARRTSGELRPVFHGDASSLAARRGWRAPASAYALHRGRHLVAVGDSLRHLALRPSAPSGKRPSCQRREDIARLLEPWSFVLLGLSVSVVTAADGCCGLEGKPEASRRAGRYS